MQEKRLVGKKRFRKFYKRISLKAHSLKLIKIIPNNKELIKRKNNLNYMVDFRENRHTIKLEIILIQNNSLIIKIIIRIKMMKKKMKKYRNKKK